MVGKASHFVQPRLAAVVASCAYVFFLPQYYALTINWFGSQPGFTLQSTAIGVLAVCQILAVVPAAFLELRREPVVLILWLTYVLLYIPSLTIAPLATTAPGSKILVFAIASCASFLLMSWLSRVPLVRPTRHRFISVAVLGVGLALGASACIVFVFYTYGVPTDIPALDAVYDQRSEFKAATGAAGPIAAYAVLFVEYLFVPLLLAGAATIWPYSRRVGVAFVGLAIAAGLVVFAIAALKSAIALFGLSMLVYWCMRSRGSPVPRMFYGLAGFVTIAWTFDQMFGQPTLFRHVVRRTLTTPGQNAGHYLTLEHEFGNDYWTHSIFRWFANPILDQAPARMSGFYIYDNAAANANAGILADGFVQASVVGVLVAGMLWGIVFAIFRFLTRDLNPFAAVMAMAAIPYALANTSMFTVLLSYGVAGVLLALTIWPPRGHMVPHRAKPEGT